jgi:D-serine deaminase-like pyridoxal phosphate-dependent protein
MTGARRGPNEALIGRKLDDGLLQTPALLLDLDVFAGNVARMADEVRAAGRLLRPHVKSHKCVEIARRQVAAGAVGLCCASLREVEVMAEAGFDGILLTAPVASQAAAARVAAVRRKVPSLMAAVDSADGLDLLSRAATADAPIDVLIEIDVGQMRTGVTDASQAVSLARRTAAADTLNFRGIQAYYGNLQHVPDLAGRRARVAEQWKRIDDVAAALRNEGLPPEIVSGSGTGTHHIDLAEGPFTEIQAGSYIFMDRQYSAIELAPEGPPFGQSLTIATRVVSTNQPNRAVIDAGLKAMATEAGPAAVFSGAPATAQYHFMGDEHGRLEVTDGEALPGFGALVRLQPPHCDPTLNLHDWLHIVQGERLVDIWRIDARGY